MDKSDKKKRKRSGVVPDLLLVAGMIMIPVGIALGGLIPVAVAVAGFELVILAFALAIGAALHGDKEGCD